MNALRTTALGLLLGTGIMGCGANAGSADPVRMPASFNPMVSLAPLVDAVEPAVVNVYTSQRMQVDPRAQWMFGLPSERTVQGQGSGFVISSDGYLLTNNHVVKGATEVKVKFSDGADYTAKVIGADADSDVALLKISGDKAFPFLRLATEDVKTHVGDWVVAVGNPLGLGHTVTAGIVSGIGRDIPDLPLEEFLQTDASINPGNSGGPLIALDGSVVGMNTAIIAGANTVGFAIPAQHISEVLPQLRENGKVARGYMGVEMASLPEAATQALGGVLIGGVMPGGPADKAGIQSGDVVIKIGDKDIENQTDVLRSVAGTAPGKKLEVVVMRKGKEKKLTVELMEKPKAPEKTDTEPEK